MTARRASEERTPVTARSADKDPICMSCRAWVGRVSWPADLNPRPNDPSASTYVCADEAHQADAAEWVEAITGHRGVFVPWVRRQAGAVQEALNV